MKYLIEDLTFSYPGKNKPVIDHLDLQVNPGDRILIYGKNSSGKSTLLHLIAGFLTPTSGRCQLIDAPDDAIIGILQQSPDNQLFTGSVREEIAFGLENIGIPTFEIRETVADTLRLTGLTHLAERSPNSLSGGEKQKVAFACIYAMNPLLWLLDEPFTFLDPFERRELLDLMEKIPSDRILICTTCREKDRIEGFRRYLLCEGELKKVSENSTRTENESPSSGWPSEVQHHQGRGNSSLIPGKVAVSLSDVTVSRGTLFRKKRKVLDLINLDFPGSGLVVLSGRNGSGKTTLLETIAGLLKTDSGTITVNHQDSTGKQGRIGFAFQFPEHSFHADTILQEVAFGPRQVGLAEDEAETAAEEALVKIDDALCESLGESPFNISAGQARRVALASIIAMKPSIYLLDEPTAGMDDENREQLIEFLRSERDRGCLIMVATHEIDDFRSCLDRWILLDRGQVRATGDRDELARNREIASFCKGNLA